MKYSLLMNGFYFNGSCHKLSTNDFERIKDYKLKNGIKSFYEMNSFLPEIIDDYETETITNFWILNTGLIDDKLRFVLIDKNEDIVWDCNYNAFSDIWDESNKFSYNEDAGNNTFEFNAFPDVQNPILLFYNETLRGTVVNFSIDSDVVPNPKDFAVLSFDLETPNADFELIDKVFFKGIELEKHFDYENYRSVNLDIDIFTL